MAGDWLVAAFHTFRKQIISFERLLKELQRAVENDVTTAIDTVYIGKGLKENDDNHDTRMITLRGRSRYADDYNTDDQDSRMITTRG